MTDPLEHDPARIAATERLLPSALGNPALDRLATLASKLLGSASAQVSLLTDEQVIAGGAGLSPDAVGSRGPLGESLCTVTARTGGPLLVADAPADDRVAGLPPVTSGAVGSYLGVPLVDEDKRMLGALCVFDPSPRAWSEADVALLGQLAETAVAELELSALAADYDTVRVRLALAIDAAGIGSFDLDVVTGRLDWDERLIAMFGYDVETFDRTLDAFNVRVHPDDRPAVDRAVQGAIESGGELDVDYRIVRPDGVTRWIAARGRALLDDNGRTVRLLGAAFDTTEDRDSATRVARVLETMSNAFFSLDRTWCFSYVNAKAEELLDRTREELLGGNIWDLFPEALGSQFEASYREAMGTDRPVEFEAYYPVPLDRWYEVRAWPGPDGLSVYFHDVTERRRSRDQAEQARREVETAAARINLLGEVSALFAAELDPELAVSNLAQLVVPALADWCMVTVLDDDGRLRDIGGWHVDPESRTLVAEYARVRLEALTEQSFVSQSVRSGQPIVVPSPAWEAIAAVLRPGRARDLVAELAPEHAAVLPLVARGRTLGVLSLFTGSGGGKLNVVDFATATEVARRAALGLDNARLYRQQRTIAEELQRSMLTAPPEPDHMQIVVRYVPASQQAQVGGDWYDAFLQPDGATVLAIGDVVGHDTASAAAMGQVRGLLRGIAYTTGERPANVLTRLDRAIAGLQVDTTATAVVARIEQNLEQRERGVSQVRWSNAGHPPPMVLNHDGTVAVLAGARADLLLGIDPDTPRAESEITLDRGATVLLYTDGLVERRGDELDDGLAQLRDALLAVGGDVTLDELCDQILKTMLPGEPDDDVALVAVRLHRQDRERPPEAGPREVPPDVPPEPDE